MSLVVGTRVGVYEITGTLGAGGMGEVYRARDGTLQRDVALKVLPELFARDPDRLARFRREAQVLAALNHSNIAAIYGFEETTSAHALVLELVEGPTLADRLLHGPMSIDEALPIARQIAAALEAAHEHGIIHRDLKPANIKLRPDGTVKVLDFGLAKLSGPPEGGHSVPRGGGLGAGDRSVRLQPDLSASPTITSPAMMTGVGVLLGTAAYMSPEQAKGRAADKRSDVWAFGAVLYEMLTGRRAFEGDDLSDTLANVLKSQPDWNALPADVPPHVRMLIQRCLTKDRRDRIADMSVALFVMADAASLAPAVTRGLTPTPRPLWRRLLMPTAATIVAGAAAGTGIWLAMRPPVPRITRFAITETGAAALSVDQVSRDIAITPDGTRIVYKAVGANGIQLFVRALDQLEPTPLTGLGSPRGPFTSPDGQWVGFMDVTTGVTLKKVAITGGPAHALARVEGNSRGATWGDDGSIIFASSARATGLLRVSSAGGETTVLTTPAPERGEADHLWPQFLPGSQAVLFTITATAGNPDASQIAVFDLRTGMSKVLVQGGSQAQYVAGGYLVYAAAGTLRAVAFDLDRLEVIGTPVPAVPQVLTLPTDVAEFDVARNAGTLVYVRGGAAMVPIRTLVWVNRQGREDAVAAAPARAYVAPRLSPDGRQVALSIRDQQDDIWIWDFARQNLARVTSDLGLDIAPVWMPDGLRVVFSSQAGGDAGSLFWQAADATAPAQRLTQAASFAQSPSGVSPNGTRLLFSHVSPGTGIDVMMLTLDTDHRLQPLVQTQFAERNGEISPDGRLLAYQTTDSASTEIFVRPFPDVDSGRLQVSSSGGSQPVWARNGELFYRAADGAIMNVRVQRGATLSATTPVKVVNAGYFNGGGTGAAPTNTARTYDVAPDGQRFLMIKQSTGDAAAASPTSIVVVQNWIEELKQLVPAN